MSEDLNEVRGENPCVYSGREVGGGGGRAILGKEFQEKEKYGKEPGLFEEKPGGSEALGTSR